jgi:exodeoxyribonuclease VII small subunit
MAEQPIPSDIASLSFEDALRALEEIVRQLEGGQVRLDEAVGAYEKGSFLKRHCEQRLAEAKAKIERITVSPDGAAAGSEPFDVG